MAAWAGFPALAIDHGRAIRQRFEVAPPLRPEIPREQGVARADHAI